MLFTYLFTFTDYNMFAKVVNNFHNAKNMLENVRKHLTNTRSSGADDALKLTPPRVLSLEQALEFIDTDELLEITPKNIRIRKKILDPTLRKRSKINNK